MRIKNTFLLILPLLGLSTILIIYFTLTSTPTVPKRSALKITTRRVSSVSINLTQELFNALKQHGRYCGDGVYKGYMGSYQYTLKEKEDNVRR